MVPIGALCSAPTRCCRSGSTTASTGDQRRPAAACRPTRLRGRHRRPDDRRAAADGPQHPARLVRRSSARRPDQAASPFTYNVSIRARDHVNDPAFPTPSTVDEAIRDPVLGRRSSSRRTTVPTECGVPLHRANSTSSTVSRRSRTRRRRSRLSTQLTGDLQSVGALPKGRHQCLCARHDGWPTRGSPEGLDIREATGDIIGARAARASSTRGHYASSNTLPTVPSQTLERPSTSRWPTVSPRMSPSTRASWSRAWWFGREPAQQPRGR